MLLINTLVANQNYIYLIFWYYFVDSSYIMPTGFDFLIYLIQFGNQSFVLACNIVMQKYIAEVIDAQISFTTTIALRKSMQFRERVHKIIAFQFYLTAVSLVGAVMIVWLLYKTQPFAWFHLIFLAYPALVNYFEL